ncbi:unnamed protein product [Musa acuminata var. zebrina]
MMVADMHPLAPPSSHSPRSNALKSLSLSHPAVVEDTSTQPLLPPPPPSPPPHPPSIHSHPELSTTYKKCYATFLDPFVTMLALCSNSIPHNEDDVDKLWLVFNAIS